MANSFTFVLLVALFTFSDFVHSEDKSTPLVSGFRPPSVPLVVVNPYLRYLVALLFGLCVTAFGLMQTIFMTISLDIGQVV